MEGDTEGGMGYLPLYRWGRAFQVEGTVSAVVQVAWCFCVKLAAFARFWANHLIYALRGSLWLLVLRTDWQ